MSKSSDGGKRPEIAVFAGPTATILNSPPLLTNPGHLRPQRLATPVTVQIEPFTAHPLEGDVAELYEARSGEQSTTGSPGVYSAELAPEDGLHLLPYIAGRRDGSPWQANDAGEPAGTARQTFYPDASRLYEEIDRFGLDEDGRGQLLSRLAQFDFWRAAPSGGYTRSEARLDTGERAGGESLGEDFFPYEPQNLRAEPDAAKLADITNRVSEAMRGERFLGVQWLEGSPVIEETLYWLSLLVDTSKPLVGHVSQRKHQTISADGARNILDGVRYIVSRAWADSDGADEVGPVLVADELAFAARDVVKTAARPGNYHCSGGLGGPVASIGNQAHVEVGYLPRRFFTWKSAVRLPCLPAHVHGVRRGPAASEVVDVAVKTADGTLSGAAIPNVIVVPYGRYGHASGSCCQAEPGIDAWCQHNLDAHPLAGFVSEGRVGEAGCDVRTDVALSRAVLCGMPVVKCGRGSPAGFVTRSGDDLFISGSNLSPSKARILLMACLLKLGAFPPAHDPDQPRTGEVERALAKKTEYQAMFDTH